MEKWKSIKQRIILEDQWIKVCSDDVLLPNGELLKEFSSVELRRWSGIVAITPKQELVMIKQYRFALDGIFLELPCGMIDEGEEPKEAAKRELLEETGYDADEDFIYLGKTSPSPSKIKTMAYCYLAQNVTYRKPQVLDVSEEIEVELIPLKDIRKLIQEGVILDSFVIANIYMTLDYLKY